MKTMARGLVLTVFVFQTFLSAQTRTIYGFDHAFRLNQTKDSQSSADLVTHSPSSEVLKDQGKWWSYSEGNTSLWVTKLQEILATPLRRFNEVKMVLPKSDAILNISANCKEDVKIYLRALHDSEPWALQMYDASGRPASAIAEGHFLWLGSFDQCLETQVQFTGRSKYCTVHFPFLKAKDSSLNITLGICMSSQCSEGDLEVLTAHADLPLSINATFMRPLSVRCHTPKQLSSLAGDPMAITALCVVAVIILVTCTSSIYEVYHDRMMKRNLPIDKIEQVRPLPNITSPMSRPHESLRVERFAPIMTDRQSLLGSQEEPESTPNLATKIILLFSVPQNAKRLTCMIPDDTYLPGFPGIQVLSVMWIILMHMFSIGQSSIGNTSSYFPDIFSRWTFMFVVGAPFAIDTLLTISGISLTFWTLKEMDKNDGEILKVQWLKYYAGRFCRYSAPYFVVLLLYTAFDDYWIQGPLKPINVEPHCRHSWWTNVLYINNFVNTDQMCMGWTWYMAVDMQLYLVAPIIIVALYKSWLVGGSIIIILILANWTSAGVTTGEMNLPAAVWIANYQNMSKWFQWIYIKPWCRLGPFLIGMATGNILVKTKAHRILTRCAACMGWVTTITLCVAVVYGPYTLHFTHYWPAGVNEVYNAMAASFWGLGMAWLAYACITRLAGIVHSILSWRGWVPLARLTHVAYIVHPVLLEAYFYSTRSVIYFSDVYVALLYIAVVFLTYVCAFFVSLLFEMPVAAMVQTFME
ncbi:O-acyltransferase like protein [Lingula anatina]|uniref:O-acyltransferase like protein n=1 Tax=Lingula anatina TaxID=7574 RepID=A0A1S3KDW6_LINAN|nr:O-acyltransferase like protein [Lingula anatina]|eukprot:XP_013420818.1 O-acyltransferase like protein [Lingula anatina]